MRIRIGEQARVYTYPEVKKMIEDDRKKTKEDFAKVVDDMVAIQVSDQLRVMTYVYMNVLADMGLQKAGMEDFLFKIADYSEEMNNSRIGFTELQKRIVDMMGYDIEDPERDVTFNNAVQKLKA